MNKEKEFVWVKNYPKSFRNWAIAFTVYFCFYASFKGFDFNSGLILGVTIYYWLELVRTWLVVKKQKEEVTIYVDIDKEDIPSFKAMIGAKLGEIQAEWTINQKLNNAFDEYWSEKGKPTNLNQHE